MGPILSHPRGHAPTDPPADRAHDLSSEVLDCEPSMRILNSAQMRDADRRTTEEVGIPAIVLMENAGRQVVAAIEAMFSDVGELTVAVLCGRGTNGGDGFVIARTLLQRGVDVSTFLVGEIGGVRGDARTNLEILGNLGHTIVEINDSPDWELHFSEIRGCD